MNNFSMSGTMRWGKTKRAFVNILLEISMLFSEVQRNHFRPRISFFYDRFRDLCSLGFLNQIKINPYLVSGDLQAHLKTICFSPVSLCFKLEGQHFRRKWGSQNSLPTHLEYFPYCRFYLVDSSKWYLSLKYIPKMKHM